MKNYVDANPESGKRFYQEFHNKGKVVMLNLLKFKSWADYTNLDVLKPENEITGEDAYQRYIDNAIPELNKAGSRILFYGNSKSLLIGPEDERWDAILLIEHQSATRIMEFNQNKRYLKIIGHRTAALEDSRLLPITEKSLVF